MEIKRFVSNLLMSNMYVLAEKGEDIIIDPFICGNDILRGIGSLEFGKALIILTHEHFDHISGVNFMKENYGVPVYASDTCAKNLQKPNRNLSRHFDAFCQIQSWISGYKCEYSGDYICGADMTFSGEAEMSWHGHLIRLIEAPGHSQGSIFIYIDDKYLFSGDSIFRDYPTGTRFTGGSTHAFETQTRPLIESRPKDTIVYPGHFNSFKIEERYVEKGVGNA